MKERMLSSALEGEAGVEADRQKYKAILTLEESFARAIAMGVQVRKPISVWHVLIPFIFVFDFMQMKAETETFTRNFLFIKKLALDAALDISKCGDRQSRLEQIENETRD